MVEGQCLEYSYPGLTDDFWDIARKVWREKSFGDFTPVDAKNLWQSNYGGGRPQETDADLSDLPCKRRGPLVKARESDFGLPARAAVPSRTLYESESITTYLIAATLGALVLAGAVLIWTRPRNADEVLALGTQTDDARGSPPDEQDETQLATAPPPLAGSDDSRIVEQLRQLKGLHEDGILTDEEYESKRERLTGLL